MAILETVRGLSPEITFIATPWLLKYSKVFTAFSLIGLASATNPSGVTLPFMPFSTFSPSYLANKSTLSPLSAYGMISSSMRAKSSCMINSGAPSRYVPSEKVTLPYLRPDEKACCETAVRCNADVLFIKASAAYAFSASMVALLSTEAFA